MQVFNVAEQGPFPVMIEDFFSRNVFLLRSNGLLPVSNVHPLWVTDLLQREDCCCYIRERLVEEIGIYNNRYTQAIKQTLLALTIASCEVSEGHSVQVQESLTPSFQSCSSCSLQCLSSLEALCLLSASKFYLREQPSFYCAVFFSVLFEPLYSVLILFWAH